MDGNPELIEPRRYGRWWILAVVAPLVVVGAVAGLRTFLPGLPEIDENDWIAAQRRWQSAEVRSYDMTVVLGGRQTGTLKTSVRDGAVTRITRNDVPMKEERTWRPWTVPGLFDTLETDFDNAAHRAEKFGNADVHIVMRAEFDPQYGFPRRYLHQVFGQFQDLTWEVTEFIPQ